MRRTCAGILALLSCLSVGYAQRDSVSGVVRTIDSLYSTGSYLSAEVAARRLLEEPNLGDSARIAAHKFIAFSSIAQEEPSIAKEHFQAILAIDLPLDLVCAIGA